MEECIIEDTIACKQIQNEVRKRTHDLEKRVDELNCLHGISKIIEKNLSLNETLQEIVDIIPSAWQFPEITCARIIFEDRSFQTENFRSTAWEQTSEIFIHGKQLGFLEVFYLEEKPEIDEGPFLKEERELINSIAERVGRTIERKKAEDELIQYQNHLKELVEKRTIELTISNKKLQQEITERKQTEQALKESENKFRTLFNSTNDAIFMHDLNGYFLEVNTIACERLGFSRNELLRMNTVDINASKYAARIADLKKEILEKEHVIFETVHVRKDGSTIPIELSSRIIDYHGKKAILCIGRDITDRKQAEENLIKYIEELKYSNELKNLFTDIMRHDLLNPASVVKGFADVLIDMEENEKKIQAIKSIERNINKLIDILESAAKFSKMESVEELEFEKMDLGLIIKEVVRNLKPQLEEKQMILDFVEEGSYPSNVNKVIEDVFSNLLSNAIKYSPKESKIIIDIIDSGNEWKVTVTDFGEGISDENKPHVFDRFKRVSKGGVKGIGLGLAIVKKIIDLHGGRVGVEDNPAGQGSVFWVTIKKA